MERCASCGSDLVFSPELHSLWCASCSNTNKIDFLVYNGSKQSYNDVDASNEMIYECECEGCGNSLSFTKSSITFQCPFCGKGAIIENFKYDISAIIPFVFGKEKLYEYYKAWVKGKFFAPSAMKKIAFIEKFEGHYVPAYVFDMKTKTSYSGMYAITKTRTVGHGDHRRTETYTEYRPFRGIRSDKIKDNMVMGGSFMPNQVLQQIEPYIYEKLEDYNPDFMQGYIVDNYVKNLSEGLDLSKNEVKLDISNRIRREAPHRVSSLDVKVTYNDIMFGRYLLPVYRCSMNYKGENYTFFVNGQTGKVYGNTPISVWKVLLVVFASLLVIGLILYLILIDWFLYINNIKLLWGEEKLC